MARKGGLCRDQELTGDQVTEGTGWWPRSLEGALHAGSRHEDLASWAGSGQTKREKDPRDTLNGNEKERRDVHQVREKQRTWRFAGGGGKRP